MQNAEAVWCSLRRQTLFHSVKWTGGKRGQTTIYFQLSGLAGIVNNVDQRSLR